MTTKLRPIKRKAYKLRKVGRRGVVIALPQSYADRYNLQEKDECLLFENERGNMEIMFRHSPGFNEMYNEIARKK